MNDTTRIGARVAVITHVVAFLIAVLWELIFIDEAVITARTILLDATSSPIGGMIVLGIVAISGVVLTGLNAVLVWNGIAWSRWTMAAWWVVAVTSTFVVGPEVQLAVTRAAILVYSGAAGVMLCYAFTLNSSATAPR